VVRARHGPLGRIPAGEEPAALVLLRRRVGLRRDELTARRSGATASLPDEEGGWKRKGRHRGRRRWCSLRRRDGLRREELAAGRSVANASFPDGGGGKPCREGGKAVGGLAHGMWPADGAADPMAVELGGGDTGGGGRRRPAAARPRARGRGSESEENDSQTCERPAHIRLEERQRGGLFLLDKPGVRLACAHVFDRGIHFF
jgi:hypothetical protein